MNSSPIYPFLWFKGIIRERKQVERWKAQRKREKQEEKSAKRKRKTRKSNQNRIENARQGTIGGETTKGSTKDAIEKFKLCTTTPAGDHAPLVCSDTPSNSPPPHPPMEKHKNHFNSIGLVVHCSRARKTEWKSWPGTALGAAAGREGERGREGEEGTGQRRRESVPMYRSSWRVCRVGLHRAAFD